MEVSARLTRLEKRADEGKSEAVLAKRFAPPSWQRRCKSIFKKTSHSAAQTICVAYWGARC